MAQQFLNLLRNHYFNVTATVNIPCSKVTSTGYFNLSRIVCAH